MYNLENSREILVYREEESCIPTILYYTLWLWMPRDQRICFWSLQSWKSFCCHGNILIFESKEKHFCFAQTMTIIYLKWIPLFTYSACDTLWAVWWAAEFSHWLVPMCEDTRSAPQCTGNILCKPVHLHVLKGLLSLCRDTPEEVCF